MILSLLLAFPLLVPASKSLHHRILNESDFVAFTTNGPIIGHPAINRSEVVEYLGIPYAQPPVGPLRFAAPQKYTKNKMFVASSWSDICPQTPSAQVDYPNETSQGPRIIANFVGGLNHTQSEDCLTLNIWRKPAAITLKPAIIFFHGGRFTTGESHTPFYNGQYFAAAEDVVIVTLNYRINIFGFPGAPGAPKNVALLDQRLAVEWVRDNIRAFGGDPEKMVLLGQSSGSVAVDCWSYAFRDDPVVNGFILHSGNVFSFPTNTAEVAEQHWYNVSTKVGCGRSGDVLECMRSKNFTTIKTAAASVKVTSASSQGRSQPAFQPTVDNQTVFSAETYTDMSKVGQFARLGYLFGNNDNEAGFYRISAYASGSYLTNAEWAAFNLEDFTCLNIYSAHARVMQGVPAYHFRYFGDWNNLRLYPNSSAYHGADLEMVFGASADVSGLPDSAPERQTQRLMMRAWAAFAEDPWNGLSAKLGWPVFGHDGASLIQLAYNNTPTAAFVSPRTYDSTCASLNLSYYDI